jgi:hypothetical protein
MPTSDQQLRVTVLAVASQTKNETSFITACQLGICHGSLPSCQRNQTTNKITNPDIKATRVTQQQEARKKVREMKGHKSPKKLLFRRGRTQAFRRQIAVGVVGLVGFVIVWELAGWVTGSGGAVWGPNAYSAFNPYGYSYINGRGGNLNGKDDAGSRAAEVDILELDQILAGFKHKYPTYQNSVSAAGLPACLSVCPTACTTTVDRYMGG